MEDISVETFNIRRVDPKVTTAKELDNLQFEKLNDELATKY